MYEGGEGLGTSLNSPWAPAYIAAQRDSGMYPFTTSLLNLLSNAGVQGLAYFNFDQAITPFGEWGSIEYQGQPSSQTPKYNALTNYINSPKLAISGLANTVMAGPQSITITAHNPNGNGIDTGYLGTVQFASSDSRAVLPATYTFTAADAGVHTFSVTLKSPGTQWITVSDTTSGLVTEQSGIVVQPGPVQSLVITNFPSTVQAGAATSFTVTLYDAYNNVATNYVGTVHFTSSDPSAGLPLNHVFTSADAGVHTFTAKMESPGGQTITATDVNTSTITGSASTTVNPLVKWDTTTLGNWIGRYGTQGYNVIGSTSSYPPYATVTVSGASTESSSSTDPRALLKPDGSGRVAGDWYARKRFTLDVNLTDGQAHDLALYLVDLQGGRQEQIQLTNATTGAVLDTQTVAAFTGGKYLVWSIAGHVSIRFTRLAGTNAVVSGLFFDPPSATAIPIKEPGSAPTEFRATTSTTAGAATPPTPPSTGMARQAAPGQQAHQTRGPCKRWTAPAGSPQAGGPGTASH
jgi:hypothetical protein